MFIVIMIVEVATNQCHWDTCSGHAGGGVGVHGGQNAAAKDGRSEQFCVVCSQNFRTGQTVPFIRPHGGLQIL